ncbi:MAG: DUF4215 domain-containing protein [Myxococcales bacterium]|jgi:fibro-slime domain-containing protein|nr:DUF4215 domain-containing protein [Myxococcales bacterium]
MRSHLTIALGILLLAAPLTFAVCSESSDPPVQPDVGPSDANARPPNCGNGSIQVTQGETCDDGNLDDGDGCSSACAIEPDWTCPMPGEPCLPPPFCGDGRIEPLIEVCDDGNLDDGDGCSSACAIEPGWACPYAGATCRADQCGDGIIAGAETCDPPGLGCDENCRALPGHACDTSGCHETICGDGIEEGDEACDLGVAANAWGQGCTPNCRLEPSCPRPDGALGSACSTPCGSGMLLATDAKACDDGNLANGDGCSSTCQIEAGWTCAQPTIADTPTLTLPIVYRDFIGQSRRAPGSSAPIHQDFNVFGGSGTRELVEVFLDADGKPVFRATTGLGTSSQQLTSAENFRLWYRDEPLAGVDYGIRVVDELTLSRIGESPMTYQFSSTGFFPIDGKGWHASGDETLPAEAPHNYSFTSEVHYWFEFKGGEVLSFYGDDDLWVFVNGRLALDLGGLHSQQRGQFTINPDGTITSHGFIGVGGAWEYTATEDFGLSQGNVYEIAIFHAERMETGSNYQLTLAGFNAGKTACAPICGDGLVTSGEVCDDGAANDTGGYGKCLPDCMGYGPRCGDGHTDTDHGESCDDGPKNGTDQSTCSRICTLGGFQ